MFPGHLVFLRGIVGWLVCSFDLNICNLFLWFFLKIRFLNIVLIEDLKERITEEIAALPIKRSNKFINFKDRLQICVDAEGRHLEDIILKIKLKKRDFLLILIRQVIFL